MRLYLVTLQGLSNHIGTSYHSCYVVADNPSQAYSKVRTRLDIKDYGFRHERELDSVRLLADEGEYSDLRTPLFL